VPSKLAMKQFTAFCASQICGGKLKLDQKDSNV